MDSNRVVGKPHANPYQSEGKILVSKTTSSGDLKANILRAVDLIGGFGKTIEKGDSVLLKPNFNSADPPPASSSPDFLRALVELLFEHGAREVVVGESSMQGTSTRRIMEKAGALKELKDTGAEVVFFDEGRWVKTEVGGKFLADVSLAMRALSVDKLVYSCCMKTHFRADFSLSLKLAFGLTKGSDRMSFHLRHLKEKLVDLNLVVNQASYSWMVGMFHYRRTISWRGKRAESDNGFRRQDCDGR